MIAALANLTPTWGQDGLRLVAADGTVFRPTGLRHPEFRWQRLFNEITWVHVNVPEAVEILDAAADRATKIRRHPTAHKFGAGEVAYREGADGSSVTGCSSPAPSTGPAIRHLHLVREWGAA